MVYFQLLGPFLLAVFSISFIVMRYRFTRLHSASYFAICYGSLAIALTFDWMRVAFNPVLASYLTNVPYTLTAVFGAAGLFTLNGQKINWRTLNGLVVVMFLLMFWFLHVQDSFIGRSLTMTIGVFSIFIFAVIKNIGHCDRTIKKIITGFMGFFAIASMLRGILLVVMQADTLSVETYTMSSAAWTLQLSSALAALTMAVLLFAHYGILIMQMLTEEGIKQRRRVEAQFSKFLSPTVVQDLLRSDEVDLKVKNRVITAFLVDMRGFTSFSDTHGTDAASQRISSFLELVTEEILDNNGTIDKYLGDAVLAFWNAPVPENHHADLAIRTAQSIQARLASSEKNMQAVVTIETGECSVGNFGNMRRMDYTAVGGAMNLVARLEAIAKEKSIPILIGPGTANLAASKTTNIGSVSIQGINGDVEIFVPKDVQPKK